MNKKSKRTIIICVIALCALIIGCIAFVSSVIGEKDICLEYDGIKTRRGSTYIVLDVENNTEKDISLGWAGSCDILVATDKGDYAYKPHMESITKYEDSISIPIRNLEGEVERIEITELCLLDDRGLPDKRLKNIVVYDSSNGIESCAENFPMFTLGNVIFVFFSVFIVGNFVLSFLSKLFQKSHKKRFFSFASANNDFMNDLAHQQAMDMHNQAVANHQEAVRIHENMHHLAHNNAMHMHDMHVNSFNDTMSHMSSTFMDMGGFNPPMGF